MGVFIQWKGTDVCMDFHCSCGYHNHYDGYFAYHVKCKQCEKIYKLGDSIDVSEVENINEVSSYLESEI